MDASSWYQFYGFVNRVARYVGHGEVNRIEFGPLGKSVHVSPTAFSALAKGREVRQELNGEFNFRSFVAGGFEVSTTIQIPQPGVTQVPGDTVDLDCVCDSEAPTVIAAEAAL